MEANEDGWIAIKRYQTINKVVSVGGEEYLFLTKANICMAWIKPEHAGAILQIKKECCGGSRKAEFRPANENDVRRWEAGGGR